MVLIRGAVPEGQGPHCPRGARKEPPGPWPCHLLDLLIVTLLTQPEWMGHVQRTMVLSGQRRGRCWFSTEAPGHLYVLPSELPP